MVLTRCLFVLFVLWDDIRLWKKNEEYLSSTLNNNLNVIGELLLPVSSFIILWYILWNKVLLTASYYHDCILIILVQLQHDLFFHLRFLVESL